MPLQVYRIMRVLGVQYRWVLTRVLSAVNPSPPSSCSLTPTKRKCGWPRMPISAFCSRTPCIADSNLCGASSPMRLPSLTPTALMSRYAPRRFGNNFSPHPPSPTSACEPSSALVNSAVSSHSVGCTHRGGCQSSLRTSQRNSQGPLLHGRPQHRGCLQGPHSCNPSGL